MNVRELNREQLNELKTSLVYKIIESPSMETLSYADDIPDAIIYDYYDEITFSKDDFFCTAGE